MAEQTLGDRDERLAANFDGTEFTECFPTSQGVSFRSKLGTASSRDVGTGFGQLPASQDVLLPTVTIGTVSPTISVPDEAQIVLTNNNIILLNPEEDNNRIYGFASSGNTIPPNGRIIFIYNLSTSNNLILVHNTGTGNRRIFTPSSSNFTITPRLGATLFFETMSNVWRVIK